MFPHNTECMPLVSCHISNIYNTLSSNSNGEKRFRVTSTYKTHQHESNKTAGKLMTGHTITKAESQKATYQNFKIFEKAKTWAQLHWNDRSRKWKTTNHNQEKSKKWKAVLGLQNVWKQPWPIIIPEHPPFKRYITNICNWFTMNNICEAHFMYPKCANNMCPCFTVRCALHCSTSQRT